MTIVLLKAAERDIADAIAWYDNQAVGLGDAFFDEVDAAFQRIEAGPQRHPSSGSFHRIPTRRFPYIIYYRWEGRRIVVFAVLSQRRDPNALKRRLG